MFPSAQMACSCTSTLGEDASSLQKIGTAPAETTVRVWAAVPLAMLVRAQADSN